MTVILRTSKDVLSDFATRFKQKRLNMNLTQAGLASRASISVGAIKHFEKTGKITLDKLFDISVALGCLDDFDKVLANNVEKPTNLFEEKEQKVRQRGQIK